MAYLVVVVAEIVPQRHCLAPIPGEKLVERVRIHFLLEVVLRNATVTFIGLHAYDFSSVGVFQALVDVLLEEEHTMCKLIIHLMKLFAFHNMGEFGQEAGGGQRR
jgi:hypothetical protein